MNAVQGNLVNQGDIQKLKNEIQSLFKNQVYAVVVPKELGQALTANGMYILGRLQAIQRQLEQTLNQNKNAGKDTTSLQTLITQINDQLKIAQEQLAIADAKFKAMNPANTEEAKAARDEGKAAFRLAKDALKEAHRLLVQLRAELRLMTGTTSPSPSASISPVLSPSISPVISPSPTSIPTLSPSPSPSPSSS
jgi:chromosome segregation ATPase